MSKAKKVTGGIVAAVVIVVALVLVALSLRKIDAGYSGVVYSMNGGIEDRVLGQGWHWIKPGQKLIPYSIGIEQSYLTATKDGDSPVDDSFSAPSSDGKGLTMELTFTYRFDEDRLPEIFTRFKGRSGKEVLNTFIKPNIISWSKEVTAKYPVTEILGEKRSELNNVLSDYLAEKFSPYGIIIENASLINIETDDETRASITRKVTAQQELELANIEAKTAKIQAEKDKEVALIEAEKNKETAALKAEQMAIEAQGKADALKIAAEAEAEANRKIAQSLTPELIEKIKYEQWNGELPQVQGSSTPIIDFREDGVATTE